MFIGLSKAILSRTGMRQHIQGKGVWLAQKLRMTWERGEGLIQVSKDPWPGHHRTSRYVNMPVLHEAASGGWGRRPPAAQGGRVEKSDESPTDVHQ